MGALIFDSSFVLSADWWFPRGQFFSDKKTMQPPKPYMIIFSVCCHHCVKAYVCVCIMVQACDDEICIPAPLFPNKDPDIASPPSCISVLRLSLFLFLSDCIEKGRERERERERGGFLYQPAANFLERFHHPAFGMGWRMGVCVAASTAEDLCALRCVLKLPRTWGCVWGWGLYCGYTSTRGITWPCVFVMISTCASSCVNGLW